MSINKEASKPAVPFILTIDMSDSAKANIDKLSLMSGKPIREVIVRALSIYELLLEEVVNNKSTIFVHKIDGTTVKIGGIIP